MKTSDAPGDCSIPCNLCGGREVEEVSQKDRDGSYLRTVICRRCGLLWTDPRPGFSQVHDYYAREYRLDYKSTYQPRPVHVYRAGRLALERYGYLRPIVTPGGRVLDFGAGAGELVYVLRKLGFDAVGIEPNEGYARFAAETLGVPVVQGFYQEAQVAPESCDAVTLFHVLEHLEAPLHAVSSIRAWLCPGGFLIVEVPNSEAVCQWPRNRFHRAHLYNFNPATLGRLFERAGYEVRDTFLSSDGGNLTVIGKKLDVPAGSASGEIAGNYQRVISILRGHTNLRHLFSGYPVKRLFGKLAQRFDEFQHTRGRPASPQILDELIEEALGGQETSGSG